MPGQVICTFQRNRAGQLLYATHCPDHPSFDAWYTNPDRNAETLQTAVQRHNDDHHRTGQQ